MRVSRAFFQIMYFENRYRLRHDLPLLQCELQSRMVPQERCPHCTDICRTASELSGSDSTQSVPRHEETTSKYLSFVDDNQDSFQESVIKVPVPILSGVKRTEPLRTTQEEPAISPPEIFVILTPDARITCNCRTQPLKHYALSTSASGHSLYFWKHSER